MDNSFTAGTKIVLRISLPTSKSRASNNPLAKRSLMVSLSWVCSFDDFRRILKNANNAVAADIAMTIPCSLSLHSLKSWEFPSFVSSGLLETIHTIPFFINNTK